MESELHEIAYKEISQYRAQLGRKYDRADVEAGEYRASLRDAAMRFVQTYTGSFGFVLDLKQDLRMRGTLSSGQLKGLLNTIASEWEKREREIEAKNVAIISTPENLNTNGWSIPDGRLTLVRPDESYRTFRLRTMDEYKQGKYSKPAGTRMIAYLCGSDNSRDYAGFGWITPDGRLQIWSRFKDDSQLAEDARILLNLGKEGALAASEAYAMRSGKCSRCGLDLTVPTSLHRGYGPDCWNIING